MIDWILVIFSIIAGIFNIQKKVCCFYIWGLVDCIYIYIYYIKADYSLTVLFLFFVGMSLYGMWSWRK